MLAAPGTLVELLRLSIAALFGVAIYTVLLWVMKVPEVNCILEYARSGVVRNKLFRRVH